MGTVLFVTKKGQREPSPLSRAIDESRTRDLRLGKPMLYQLSYYRKSDTKISKEKRPLVLSDLFLTQQILTFGRWQSPT